MMRWLLIRGLLGLLIGLGPSIGGAAQTVGTSSTQIQFYTSRSADKQTPTTVQQIPQGDVVYATKAVKAAPNRFVGQWQQVLATGRLPQTGGPSESLLSVARVPDLNGTLIRVAGA
ncbi:cell surface protein [Lactiplantibacillus plantarum]|uniref:cell surface protein n=1 Tax=Lactiplantibacillus plantarum TaxID=1590 RepID=UPI002014C535|nr:cell surface protein [Lactiplantibacillus plantarum]